MADSKYAPRPDEQVSTPNDSAAVEENLNLPPNPFLTEPVLHIIGLDPVMSDSDIAPFFKETFTTPIKINSNRDVEPGQIMTATIQFQTLAKAEKAYATVRKLPLHINPDGQDPKPSSKPRLLKQLPASTDDAFLYDMFRAYGPIARSHRILTNPAGQHTGFRGMAVIEFYNEADAQRAQEELHCTELEGKTLSVSIDNVAHRPSRTHEFSPSAPAFVPGGSGRPMNAAAASFTPPPPRTQMPGPLNHQQAGPIINVPNSNLQYSASAATYIDPTNLFCKDIDPAMSSNDLFEAFRKFGKIVSARVMRDDAGNSREFGFVSFTQAEDASRALHAMHNTKFGTKTITVRLHEPKRMRQEKLANKFGSSSRSLSGGGESSPIMTSGDGEGSETRGSPAGTPGPDAKKAERRQSNSYFKAAMASENGQVDAAQLSALSYVVRNEVIAGEFSKRVKDLPGVKAEDVDSIVAELSQLKLAEAVTALNTPIDLISRVTEIRDRQEASGQNRSSEAPAASSSGGLLSAPIVPSGAGGENSSMMSSSPATGKERERLLKAISALPLPAGTQVEDITDMLVSLPKKERAMALFNSEFLRTKVDEAREILEMNDEEDGVEPSATPLTSQSVKAVKGAELTSSDSQAQNGSSTSASSSTHTLASLARLPAQEIVRLASSPQSGGLPLPKADPSIVSETDTFIDGLMSLSPQDQKQKLGEVLFKKVRSAVGKAAAPKITISLLDSEDLRSLAHLMNSYPECLKEKVIQQAPAK